MTRGLLWALAAFALVAMACTPAAQPVATAPVAAPTTAPAAKTFVRSDAAPLGEMGNFKVVSQTPWPGDKVRIFFLGVQF